MTDALASGVRRRDGHLPLYPASSMKTPARAHPLEGRAATYPLSRPARRVLLSLARGLCPPAPAPRSTELLLQVADGAQRMMRHMHPAVSGALSLLLWVLDWVPVFLLKSWHRLHRLPPERIRGLIGSLARSRWATVRLAATAIRGLVVGAYFDQREVHAAMGYFPARHIAERVALRRALIEEERISAAE